MANELDQAYFTNHVHRILRPSDDALGEASAHGLSLASNIQIGTTGAALKIFKLDSTGNLTTSNGFVLKGTSGENSNKVTVEGTFITTKNVGIGTSSPVARVHIQAGTTPSNLLYGGDHLVITNNTSNSIRLVTSSNDAANFYSSLTLVSSRGTNDAPAASQNGDRIGRILAQGMATGVTRQEAAQILFSVDGAPTGTSVPGAIRFFTSAPTGTNLERMRITASGNLLIGQTATLITNSTSTYPSVEPRVEVLTGAESGAYDDAFVLRHAGNDGNAVSRRIFLLFKHSSEDDSNASNKMTGFVSRSTSSWANSPELGFISGGNERMTLSNAGSLSVSGGIVASGGITTSGSLNVSGTSTLRGNTDILGNLTLTGTFSTPSYTINNGSGGGNTWASFSKRIFSNALAVSSDPFDQTNGAPWYGVGLSTGSFPNTANAYVQLAGFFGVLIKAAGGSSIALQSDGKVGINNTAPASGLDVASDTVFRSGVTVSGILNFNEYTNFVPTKNVHIGYWSNTAAGTVGTWYKIASFSGAAVAYSASSFMGSVLLANTNWGDSTPTEHFFAGNIVYYNSSGVLTDTASLKTSANFPSGLLQLVRTGTAGWELQLGLYSQYKIISWKIEPIAGYSPTYFDRAAAGTALATGTVTDSFDSRLGTMFGRSLDLTSTLQVDGRTDINNQLFVSGTSDQILGLSRYGAVSTGGLGIYHYLKDDANAYIQDTTMLFAGGGLTGGLIYSAANASAKHRFHIGGFNGTSSEKMQLNTNGLRLGFTSDQSTNGAATTDELQIAGSTFLSGLVTILKDNETLRLAGTSLSYIAFYPTGASAGSTNGRDGYIGFASSANKDLYLHNAVSTGSIRLRTSGADRVFIHDNGGVLIGETFNTGGSTWTKNNVQLVIGGDANTYFNAATAGSGTGVKLLIHGYDNEDAFIYPLYIEDENANADFWVRGRKVTAPTRNTTVYVGGDLGIGTSAPGAALDVNSSAIIRGGLTVSGSLGVSGTTSSVFNTAVASSSVASSNLWFELGTITLTTKFQQESARLELTNDGGSGSEDQSLTASVMFRVKQQNEMTGPPYVDVLVPYAMGRIAADDIIAVATQDDASAKVIKLHARLRTNYDNFKVTILNNDLGNFSFTRNATGTAALPAGTQYTGIAGFYADSVGRIGINTSSPASGLDVNSDSVFRSGVTITGTLNVSGTSNLDDILATGAVTFRSGLTVSGSTLLNTLTVSGNTTLTGTLGVTGLTSLNTLTTTGVVNANSLNVSGNTTVTGTLGVSDLTSLNTLTTTGVVNANSLNVSGNTSITGNTYLALGSSAKVGINTSSPASGLDVNDNAVFRSGVTISNFVADPASTNLALYSDDFSQSPWSAISATKGTTSSVTFPDGTVGTGSSLIAGSGGVNAYVQQSIAITASNTYTFSVWIRAVSTAGSVDIYIADGTGGGISSVSCSYTSSFQRFSVTRTIPAGVTSVFVGIGRNTTLTNGETINVWGAQFENKPFATSRIATTATTASAGDAIDLNYPVSRRVLVNDLTVTGNATVSGNLNVSGSSSINTLTTAGLVNANSLNVSSNTTITGTLGVTGLTSLNTLTTNGVVNANSLNVSGNTFITGTLNVSGTSNLDDVLATDAVTFRSGLTVSGSTSLNTLTLTGSIKQTDQLVTNQLVGSTEIFNSAVLGKNIGNIIGYSENFSQWANFYSSPNLSTVTSDASTSPLGDTTADKIDSSLFALRFRNTTTFFGQLVSGIKYTFSVWIKAADNTNPVNLIIQDYLSAGAPFIASKQIIPTSEWQRFSVTCTTTSTNLLRCLLGSTVGGASFFAWGAQFSDGDYPTVYNQTPLSSYVYSEGNLLEVDGINRKVGLSISNPLAGLDVNVDSLFRQNTVFRSALTVSGSTLLNTLTVSGNTTLTGTLGVSGTANLDDVLATGAVTFRSGLTVSGSTSLNTLTVTGSITVPNSFTAQDVYYGTEAAPLTTWKGAVNVKYTRFGDWAMVWVADVDTTESDETVLVGANSSIVAIDMYNLPVNPVLQHFSLIGTVNGTNNNIIAKFSGNNKYLILYATVNGGLFSNGNRFKWPQFTILVRLA